MAVMPVTYSPNAVARRFEILKEVEIGGTACQIIWDVKLPFAAIINAVPEMIKDEMRHRVIATLELQRRPQLEGVLVKDFWESMDIAQIEGVVVDGVIRDFGLAILMYETIANRNREKRRFSPEVKESEQPVRYVAYSDTQGESQDDQEWLKKQQHLDRPR